MNDEDEFLLFESNLDLVNVASTTSSDDEEEISVQHQALDEPNEDDRQTPTSVEELLVKSIHEYYFDTYNRETLEKENLVPLWALLSSFLFQRNSEEMKLLVRHSAGAVCRQAMLSSASVSIFAPLVPFVVQHAQHMDWALLVFTRCVLLLNIQRFLPRPPKRRTRIVQKRITRTRRIPRRTKLSDLQGEYDLNDSDFEELIAEVRLPTFMEEEYSDVEDVEEVYYEQEERPRVRSVGFGLVPRTASLQSETSGLLVGSKIHWDEEMADGDEQLDPKEIRMLETSNVNVWYDLENIDEFRNADETSTEADYDFTDAFASGDGVTDDEEPLELEEMLLLDSSNANVWFEDETFSDDKGNDDIDSIWNPRADSDTQESSDFDVEITNAIVAGFINQEPIVEMSVFPKEKSLSTGQKTKLPNDQDHRFSSRVRVNQESNPTESELRPVDWKIAGFLRRSLLKMLLQARWPARLRKNDENSPDKQDTQILDPLEEMNEPYLDVSDLAIGRSAVDEVVRKPKQPRRPHLPSSTSTTI